ADKEIRNRCGRGTGARVRQAVHIFNGSQNAEVIEILVILAGFHYLPIENGGDLVVATAVFVEGHDEQTVMGLRPSPVGLDVVLEPSIALGNSAIVHVID